MSDPSADYIAKEEAPKQKPVELYHIWQVIPGGEHRYITSGDVAISFDCGDGLGVKTYVPAIVKRSLVSYDSSLEATKMTITAGPVEEPFTEYVIQNPVDPYWVMQMRLHRDQSPLEAMVIFVGQIKNVGFQGAIATAECVGFEHFLSMAVPLYRYQLNCNWQVFDDHCGLDEDGNDPNGIPWKVTTAVTLDSTKTILTSSDFAGYEDSYFTFGQVMFGNETRSIVDHVGNTIKINFAMVNLASGNTVIVLPGCDGRIETCLNKFNNLLQYLGFPFMPEENPTLRT